jgi:hypothetical protein
VIVIESLHFLEKACKAASECQNGFAVYEEMVKSLPLFNALVTVTYKAYEGMMASTEAIRHNPGDHNAKEAMESAEKRAQAATNILRLMVNCKCPKCKPSSRSEHSFQACNCVVAAGGIIVLTKLQQATLVRIKNNCVITIHTVLNSLFNAIKLHPDAKTMYSKAREQFMEGRGVHVMSELMKPNQNQQPAASFLTIVCGCLYYSTKGDNDAKRLLLEQNGTAHMMQVLSMATHENLIEIALKVFQGLATSPENKKFINQNNGIELVARFVKVEGRSMIKKLAASTVRNLSDSARQINNPKVLADDMLRALAYENGQVAECLLGAISNLCVINENYKLAVYQSGAIELLAKKLPSSIQAKAWKIVEPSLSILKYLTNKNLHINNLQNQIDFIEATRHPQGGPLHEFKPCLLFDQCPRSIVKIAIMIVRNLAQTQENQRLLHQLAYVNQIITITLNMHREWAFSLESKGPQSLFSKVEDTSLFDMLEACFSCLKVLTATPENCKEVCIPEVIAALKDTLHSSNQFMSTNQPPSIKNLLVRLTKVICSVLQELSKRPEGAYYISKEEVGGSCQSIKVLIGNFQQCKPESMEHYIAHTAVGIMNDIERVTQAIGRGEIQPPSLAPMQPNRNQGPPPMPGACPPNRQLPPDYGHQGGMFPGSHGPPPQPPPRGMGPNFGPPGQQYPPNMPPHGPGFDDMMQMSDIPPGMGGPPNMHGGFDHGGMGPNMDGGPPPPPPPGNNFMFDDFGDGFGPGGPGSMH